MCNDMHMDYTFLLVVHYTLCKQKPSYWELAVESRIINVTCKQKQQFFEMHIEIVIDKLSANVAMNFNICMFIYICIL
jgi:hypothetical protein